MKRWEGPAARSGSSSAPGVLPGALATPAPRAPEFQRPASPAAQDPSPLTPGDVVVVYMDPWRKEKREGVAVLVKPRVLLNTLREPLEYWDVRLSVVESHEGGAWVKVPSALQFVSRAVHPLDRTALARDVLASSPKSSAGQTSLLEDDTERALR